MNGYRGVRLLIALHHGKDDMRTKRRKGRSRQKSGSKHPQQSRTRAKILDAAAFQDHLARDLNMSLRRGRRHPRRPERNDVSDLHYDPQPTLAQKRGLVEPPPARLTDREWESIERKSCHREGPDDFCPICREPFKLKEQVILSCGHVFHRQCLKSFENFVRANKRSCPICRKANYQKKLCENGAKRYRLQCMITLQSAWRGFLARREYYDARRKLYESNGGNPILRRKFLLRQLEGVSKGLGHVVRARESTIDRLFEEADRSLALSRSVFGQNDGNTTSSSPVSSHNTKRSLCDFRCHGTINWSVVLETAEKRALDGGNDCPICMSGVSCGEKCSVVLSCSHVFHRKCLDAFESFNIYEVLLCPMCRDPYLKCPIEHRRFL